MLTPAQEQVLARPSHTAIIANAGSGKTRVLVEQYIKFLLDNHSISPRDIVTITFSEQSARDIKKKIREAVLDRITNENDEQVLKRLYQIQDRLQSATITTIHAFCAQLLRNYPVESKTDSAFGIVSSPEDQLLREECVQQTLYDAIAVGYKTENKQILEFIKKYGRRQVTNQILSLFSKRFSVKSLQNILDSRSDEEIASGWQTIIEAALDENVIGFYDRSYYAGLLEYLSKKTRPDAEQLLAMYDGAELRREKLIALSEILSYFHSSKWESIHGTRFKNVKETLLASLPENLGSFRSYRLLIDSYILSEDIQSFLMLESRSMRILLGLFREALDLYNERKEHYSILDFDDMLWKANELLERPEIRSELSARYPFILVDEYQDTDDLQYEIIRSLTANFTADNRLIIVGDPKQSIYGFRNANIALFDKTTDEIADSTKLPAIELKESFRMLAHPMAFINKLFSAIFSSGKAEIEYNELILARTENAKGTVEILVKKTDSTDRISEDSENEDDLEDGGEPDLIAAKILQITDKESTYKVYERDQERAVTFQDIGILLRSRTHLEKIESIFRVYNIPYVTYGGRGFYTSQEIKDIINYLAFLVNPSDDVALFGILRSPYFNISDRDLFLVSATTLKPRSLSFWSRFQSFATTNDAPSLLKRANEQLRTNLELVGKLTSTNLIEKIYTETMIFGVYELYPESEQKIANLQKFSDLSVSFHLSGFQSTFDFLERIMLLSEREEEEAVAESLTHANAVHIMTIHGSKGLEFPVVFLPFLHRRISGGDGRKNSVKLERGVGISINDPESESTSPLAEYITIRSNERGLEEEKRIFYVGATRARDHLILSAKINKESIPNNSYLKWISDSCSTNYASDISFSELLKRYDSTTGQTTEQIENVVVPVVTDIPFIESPVIEVIERVFVQPSLVHTIEIPYEEGMTRYSPSQLLVYKECPTKYHLRFNLGIPEDPRLSSNFEAADSAEMLRGTVVGQLVHGVLQHIDTIAPLGVLDDTLFTSYLRTTIESLGMEVESSIQKYSEKIRSHVDTFVTSNFGKKVLVASPYFTEHALRAKLNQMQMLSGVIDRLYLDTDGWHILDYKTDRIINDPAKDERYRFQLKFYAYLIKKLFDIDTDIHAHLFYTNFGVTKDFVFTPLDLADIESNLTETVSRLLIDKRVTSLENIIKNREHCKECSYFNVEKNLCVVEV
jgi:ATP-dependent helicase/nuclease subunit A